MGLALTLPDFCAAPSPSAFLLPRRNTVEVFRLPGLLAALASPARAGCALLTFLLFLPSDSRLTKADLGCSAAAVAGAARRTPG
ncbi:hypothetical protein AGDE_14220 [Angomonas deanei]|nr:hypothetical protein AGDE_14220 [Angomonas deanei]|eukprot:EPY21205.1 hypothetical protein AGDE_14220 [Angomonas deanei]